MIQQPFDVQPLGDRALLLLFAAPDPLIIAQFAEHIRVNVPGVVDAVAALDTLTILFHPRYTTVATLMQALQSLSYVAHHVRPAQQHIIPVRYDGPDLAEIAAQCKLSAAQVIELHSNARYTVAMIGFLPGFPYMIGLPSALHLPRRAVPRPRVAAGAVAIANEQTGIYPQASPGGWHIIGHTPLRLFDVTREQPALLQAGDEVRFVVQP